MTNGYLFREYIGAQFTGVQFTDVPINAMLSFHFLLSFCIDYTPVDQQPTPAPTNGVFSPFWDTDNLSPDAVAAIKAAHPNVAVMAGLGGDSVQDIVKAVFTPTSVDSWVDNAVTSLTGIINTYGLDGVDVDYEHFADGVDVNTFVECIGGLLTQLKQRFPYITTSIAPFEDPVIQEYYQPLWRNYSDVIDYVNFQFYGYGDNTDVATYVEFYNNQSANYPGGKVLASFMTGNTTGLISPDLGISAAKELQRQNKLPGLFIWSADSSKQSSYGFKYETEAQQIIANH
uniref:Chitinase n=1 Tax=Saccharum hybrid cultivar R570 TaxID=131158 RepID=A0A059PZS2_9POAL|nr:chitinase [Saccharum hybrid cultivar R570]AWA44757.1 Chitinase [Saccharum officinarum]